MPLSPPRLTTLLIGSTFLSGVFGRAFVALTAKRRRRFVENDDVELATLILMMTPVVLICLIIGFVVLIVLLEASWHVIDSVFQ